MSYDAFVSYATPDRAITMALVDDLEARGLTCWIAPRDVPGGSKYAEVILKALAESEVFLLVFSENSNASEHVQREVERALHGSKKIVPVRIADVLPSGAMDYYLATLHWIDAFGAAREGSFDVTAEALASLLGKELRSVPAIEAPKASTAVPNAEPMIPSRPLAKRAAAKAVISQGPPIQGPSKANSVEERGGRKGVMVVAVAVVVAGLGLTLWKTIDRQNGDEGLSTAETETKAAEPVVPEQGAPFESPQEPGKRGSDVTQMTSKEQAEEGSREEASSSDPPEATAPAGEAETPGPEAVGEPESKEATGPAVEMVSKPVVPYEEKPPPVPPVAVPVRIEVSPINFAGSETVVMPKQEPAPPVDPMTEAVAAAGEAWSGGDRQAARTLFEPVVASTEAGDELSREDLGEKGVALLRRMVVAAAEDADSGEWQDFQSVDAWREVIDFSERLGIDDLAAQRQRFDQGWAIAQAESQWQAKQLDATAESLAEIAARSAVIANRLEAEGDALGKRLKALLDDVSLAAGEGRLGTMQVLGERWRPALELAGKTENPKAIGVLARLSWDAGDAEQAASYLARYEQLTRGVDTLDPTVADLLGEVIREAEGDAGTIQIEGRHWEPALELARTYEMRGSLQVLADLIHARNPEAAAPLYRQMYGKAQAEGSLRNRIGFCLQMLKRYDLGEEASFYRSQLDEAFETTLQAMDQPSSGGELIEEIPEIRDAADAGIAPAQYIMGDLLSEGKGLEKDAEEAFKFYRKAAASDYARAKYAVGECYRDGRGVSADSDEALRIWRGMSEADAAEVPQVLFNLAGMSASSEESEQLYAQARPHYEAKVRAGQVAKYGSGLGQMLVSGWGGETEAKRGYRLLEASAEKGSSHGAFLAGLLLVAEVEPFIGMRAAAGIERNLAKGTQMIKGAARDGYPNALAWCKGNDVAIEEE